MTTMVEARPRLDGLSDAELVARAQAGDRQAFDPLYRRYAADVARYAAARTVPWGRGPEFAEDVAASTWLVALEKIHQFQGRECDGPPFKAWLCGVAKHQVFNTAAAERPELVTAAADLERAGDSAPPGWWTREDGHDEARWQQLRARVDQAVAELGPTQREVALLKLDGGLSPEEIAEQTGLTRRQVRNNWQHAKASLQRSLRDLVDEPEPVDLPRMLDELAAAGGDPEMEQARAALRERLDRVVAELPPAQREVARLRLDGLSPAAIAEQTGRTAHQVRNSWYDAKRALARHPILTTTAAGDGHRSDLGEGLRRAALAETASADPLLQLRILDQLAAAGGDPEVEQARAALRERLDRVVAELPPAQREVARLRLDGLSPAAIAEQTGRSPHRVTWAWYDAKRAIEHRLTGQHPVAHCSSDRPAEPSHPTSDTTATAGADASPVDARGPNVDDDASTAVDDPSPVYARRVVVDDSAHASTPAEDSAGWRHERQLVGACVSAGAVRDRARADASGPTSDATAAPNADASPDDPRRPAADDSADDDADASTPDTEPVTGADVGSAVWEDPGRDVAASHYASVAADDRAGWRHERQLVGAGVRASAVRDRARVDADDDADGW